ncbi:MAG TPA: hypothetical protein VD886_11515 [Herpetosiphonaceae bacterium]|nr:hypothetical protein [Herpetosiphonaceae bacterium]
MTILINGSINAGKTTVAKALCELLPRTAHVEVDSLHDFIGWMDLEESIPLNLKNAAAVGRNFLEYGLNVVISYPLNPPDYQYLAAALDGFPLACFTLSPPLEVARRNRGARVLSDWERERIAFHYATGIASPAFGAIIDNAAQTPRQTAAEIASRLGVAPDGGCQLTDARNRLPTSDS